MLYCQTGAARVGRVPSSCFWMFSTSCLQCGRKFWLIFIESDMVSVRWVSQLFDGKIDWKRRYFCVSPLARKKFFLWVLLHDVHTTSPSPTLCAMHYVHRVCVSCRSAFLCPAKIKCLRALLLSITTFSDFGKYPPPAFSSSRRHCCPSNGYFKRYIVHHTANLIVDKCQFIYKKAYYVSDLL
jgi:hypothetical protein